MNYHVNLSERDTMRVLIVDNRFLIEYLIKKKFFLIKYDV